MTVFGQMLNVIERNVSEYETRVTIYEEIIQVIEGERLMPSTCFLLGSDPAFDEAHQKVKRAEWQETLLPPASTS